MIASSGDEATADLFHRVPSARVRRFPPDVQKRALRKLDMLNAAADISDMRAPPSNHLEKLAGELEGFWSVRVNAEWRIIFRWSGDAAPDVRLVDYQSEGRPWYRVIAPRVTRARSSARSSSNRSGSPRSTWPISSASRFSG